MTIFATIVITAVLTAIVTAGGGYLYLLRPTIQQKRRYYNRALSLSTQLAEQQADQCALQADLVKWIEHECKYHKAPAVGDALNQRIKERLEVLEQRHLRREALAR